MSTLERLVKPKKYIEEIQKQFEPRLMTTAQLADYLNMARGSIYNAVSMGHFPFKPILIRGQGKIHAATRWDKRAVDRWLDSQAVQTEQTKVSPRTPRGYKASQASTGTGKEA